MQISLVKINKTSYPRNGLQLQTPDSQLLKHEGLPTLSPQRQATQWRRDKGEGRPELQHC